MVQVKRSRGLVPRLLFCCECFCNSSQNIIIRVMLWELSTSLLI